VLSSSSNIDSLPISKNFSGELSGTPTNLDVGIWEVTISCDDGNGGVASHTFNITVKNINDAPVINTYSPASIYPTVEEGKAIEFNITYSDEDSSAFSIKWILDNQSVRSNVPFWTYVPAFSTAGDHQVTVNITDSGGASISHSWMVIVTRANRVPIIEEFSPMNLKPVITQDISEMLFNILATDPDLDQLIYKWFIDGVDTGERTNSFTFERSTYSSGVYNLTVIVTDTSGASIEQTWTVNVKASNKEASIDMFPYITLLVAVFVVIVILVFIILKKRHPTAKIEDIFLITNSGILLAHKTKELRPDIDDTILSGMLTAIQDFIKDAFKDKTKFGLKRLDFGDSEIHLKRGNGFFIAVVLSGDGNKPANLEKRLDKTASEIEAKYGKILSKWSGNLNQVRGIKDQLDGLLK